MSPWLGYKAHFAKRMIACRYTKYGRFTLYVDAPDWKNHVLFFDI